MFFNRITSKQAAKELIRTSRPSPCMVTLVYILMTAGVVNLVEIVAPNPFSYATFLLNQGYDPGTVFYFVFGQSSALVGMFLSIILSLYTLVVGFGYMKYSVHLLRGESTGYGTLIEGFNLVVKLILTQFLTTLFITLWTMLFIVPGIIAAYRYSQVFYCLIDDPSIGSLEAIRRSKEMMKGKKMDLFLLQITFIGYYLLIALVAGITGGILAVFLPESVWWLVGILSFLVSFPIRIWVTPYVSIVLADFHNHLIGWQPGGGYRQYQGPELQF